jgi:hypothetical protein
LQVWSPSAPLPGNLPSWSTGRRVGNGSSRGSSGTPQTRAVEMDSGNPARAGRPQHDAHRGRRIPHALLQHRPWGAGSGRGMRLVLEWGGAGSGLTMIRQGHLIAVVGVLLMGCVVLLMVVGCAGMRSKASKQEEQVHTETTKEQTRAPEATASEEARCAGTRI